MMIAEQDGQNRESQPREAESRQAWQMPKLRCLDAVDSEIGGGPTFDGLLGS